MIGLKPDLEGSELKFKRAEGIFYKLCKRAEQNYRSAHTTSASLKPFEEVLAQFLKPLQEKDEEIKVQMASGKASFWITDINPSNLSFRKQSGGTHHSLSIDTMKELYESTREFTSGLRYYYVPLLDKLWELGRLKAEKVELKKYVLVIDEINRANISKVFGELITLLEADKRIGEDNELKVSIPNSDKEFGVPPNLYVLGTMNTADKSIALIDIALRRRFEFVGMYPAYEEIEDESARELLKQINKVVYDKKSSADYLIGHAYFMNEDSVEKVLKTKVIPLLTEYFMGKTKFVEEVFKDTNWKVTYSEETYSWDIAHP
ncbi:MAG: AAA family ATPase [Cyclobacteriaceae bacterium]|nr:AAA family ATPase [Cyclobacteriaceae bacterium]